MMTTKLLEIYILLIGIASCNSLSDHEWNVHNLDLDVEEAVYPSPYPTPWEEHPRNTPPPTISPRPTTRLPTSNPSHSPTTRPTHEPSPRPSVDPATAPTPSPTLYPTVRPTLKPTPFPSLPNHVGSQAPTPHPTLARSSLAMDYILFGASVTLADMMVITATIWGAIFVMGLTYMYRSSLLGDSTQAIRLDEDMSTHSDISSSVHSEYQDSTRGPGSGYPYGSGGQQVLQPSATRNPLQQTQSYPNKPPASAMESASSLSRLTSALREDDEEMDLSLRSAVFTTRSPATFAGESNTLSVRTGGSSAEPAPQSISTPVAQTSASIGDSSLISPSSMSITTAPAPLPDEEEDSLPL